jgi:lysophospholipase L1-like esterase
MRTSRIAAAVVASLLMTGGIAHAETWVATWTAAQQGAFGAPAAPAALSAPGEFQASVYFPQPDTIRFALPKGAASDQTFRMVMRPDIWSDTVRIRFSNVWGKEPLTIGAASVGLQEYSAAVVKGSASPVTFGGKASVTIAPGERVFSDPVKLGFVSDATRGVLAGRNLAVSLAIQGTETALSYHDSAYQTSYISPPGSGDHSADTSGAAFPFTTTSWFIVDEVDASAAGDVPVVVTVGDSITDGTLSTNNVNDRWPDVLAYRLHAEYGDKVSVVNAAINANALISPMVGEAALKRLDRDVLGVSGVKTVVLLEGINDLGGIGSKPEDVIAGYKEFAQRLHDKGIRVVAGTLTPSYLAPDKYPLSTLGAQYAAGYAKADAGRKQLNDFIRTSGTFDAVIDFEAAMIDPATGGMKDEYAPNSMGGPGDYLHPNHGGYLAMGEAIDLKSLFAQ